MCKWDKDSKNGDKMSGNNISMESIEKKKRIAIFICIHVQYELQSHVSIIEHHPQGN